MNGGAIDGWGLVCLAVMAVSLLAMAAGQVVLAIMAARTARQTIDTLQEFRRDIKPIVEKAQRIADDASKATGLALVQMERINQVTETTAQKIDATLTVVQDAVNGPVRQGAAVVAGIRAAMEVFRAVSERRAAKDEDDGMFIG